MKFLSLAAAVLALCTAACFAGPEAIPTSGKEMKQVATTPEPCPEWYGRTEWNVGIWGAYAFTGTENDRTGIEDTDDFNVFGTYDRFLGGDHAWGGGLDVKYFFMKYFGVGVEGFALGGRSTHAHLDDGSQAVLEEYYSVDHHIVGGALGTLTFRFPIGCSRFAPYVWGGGGGIFGGRNDHSEGRVFFGRGVSVPDRFNNEDVSGGMGQVGGGMEVRVTRHIGITGDFSWNVVDGPKNNFGMVRTGLNFAF
jgi:hypothetical protein